MESGEVIDFDEFVKSEVTQILNSSAILRDVYEGDYGVMWGNLVLLMDYQDYSPRTHDIPIGTAVQAMDIIRNHNMQVSSGEIKEDHAIAEPLIENWTRTIDTYDIPTVIQYMKDDLRTTRPLPFESYQGQKSLLSTTRLILSAGTSHGIWTP